LVSLFLLLNHFLNACEVRPELGLPLNEQIWPFSAKDRAGAHQMRFLNACSKNFVISCRTAPRQTFYRIMHALRSAWRSPRVLPLTSEQRDPQRTRQKLCYFMPHQSKLLLKNALENRMGFE
jgi:hypothetical protein